MKKLEKTTKEKLLKENQELKAEISRLKKAEEALKESEEKFRFIEENLQEGLWITDKKDLMVYFNKAMEGISGAKSKDVLGLNVLKDFPKETIQYFKNYYLKAKKTLIPTQYEADVIAPNGRKTIQKGWLIPRINNEVFSGMVCTIEDITEHKQAQEALVASLQLSEDLFRASFSGIYVYEYQEPDRLILVDANAMAEKMTGVKLCDWKGREFNEIWPQARKDGWTDTYLEVVRSGKTVERDNIVYEDERVSVAIQAKIFQLPNQKVAVSFEDITKRTQAEEAIKESEEKYRALFERESDAIFLHDPVDTKIIIANKATSKLYGYDNDELIGMSCLEFSTEVEKSVSAMKAVQKSGDVVIPVRYHKKKDGTVFPVDISGYKIILGGKELQ